MGLSPSGSGSDSMYCFLYAFVFLFEKQGDRPPIGGNIPQQWPQTVCFATRPVLPFPFVKLALASTSFLTPSCQVRHSLPEQAKCSMTFLFVLLTLGSLLKTSKGLIPRPCRANLTRQVAVCCPIPEGRTLPCGGPGFGACRQYQVHRDPRGWVYVVETENIINGDPRTTDPT